MNIAINFLTSPFLYRVLASYNGLEYGSTIYLAQMRQCKMGFMYLYIKTLYGKTIVLVVQEDESIVGVKHEIQEKEGIPANQQRLVYLGYKLENGR